MENTKFEAIVFDKLPVHDTCGKYTPEEFAKKMEDDLNGLLEKETRK